MPDDDIRLSQELCSFIAKSPTAFHAANEMARMLDKAGLTRLREGERWELVQGKGYYTMRNDSSIVAWKVPEHFEADSYAFQFAAAHTADSEKGRKHAIRKYYQNVPCVFRVVFDPTNYRHAGILREIPFISPFLTSLVTIMIGDHKTVVSESAVFANVFGEGYL